MSEVGASAFQVTKFEDFKATEFNKILSGLQPRQVPDSLRVIYFMPCYQTTE